MGAHMAFLASAVLHFVRIVRILASAVLHFGALVVLDVLTCCRHGVVVRALSTALCSTLAPWLCLAYSLVGATASS